MLHCRFAPTGVRSLWGEEEARVSKVSQGPLSALGLLCVIAKGKINTSLLEVNNVIESSVLLQKQAYDRSLRGPRGRAERARVAL